MKIVISKAKQLVFLIFAIVIMLMALASCNNRLRGTYVSRDGIFTNSITFNGDIVTISLVGLNISGTYEIREDQLIVTTNILDVESEHQFHFARRRNTLIINGSEFVRER